MRQFTWAFLHVRLCLLAIKLWMDGFPWNEVRIRLDSQETSANDFKY